MGFLEMIVIVIVLVVVLSLVNMPEKYQRLIVGLIVLAVVLWVLGAFKIIPQVIQFPR